MKLLQFVFLFVFTLSVSTACKKNTDPITIPASDVAGRYQGKYGTDEGASSVFFSFNLKENGTLEELNASAEVIGTGSWTMKGNVFQASYHYVSQPIFLH